MAIQGLRNTTNFAADVRPKNWREGILLQKPNGMFPLFALTSQMRKEVVDDPEYNWFEKCLNARRLVPSSEVNSSATTVSVSAGAKLVSKNTMLFNEATKEILFVSASPESDTSLTVTRGFAGTTAAAVATTDRLLVIGTAFPEGSKAPVGLAYDPYKRYNKCQIFRRTTAITGTASKTKVRTGDEWREQKRECAEYISIDIEQAMWFSKQSETTLDGQPIRTMDGIMNQIDPANTIDCATTYAAGVSFDDLQVLMKDVFKYGSSEKLCFCGDLFLLTLQQIIQNTPNCVWKFDSTTKEYGMDVTRLKTPFGTVVFKTCPLFNLSTSDFSGDTPIYGYDSHGFILDMEQIRYVHVDGRDLHFEDRLEEIGEDAKKSGYIAECSIKVAHKENHFHIANLAKAKPLTYNVAGTTTLSNTSIAVAPAAGASFTIAPADDAEFTVAPADDAVFKTQEQQSG